MGCGQSHEGANPELAKQWKGSNMDDSEVQYWLDCEPLKSDWDVEDADLFQMAHENWELKAFCHGLPEQGRRCKVPLGRARFAVMGLPGHGKSSCVTNIINGLYKSTVYKQYNTNGLRNVVEVEDHAPICGGLEHGTLGSTVYPKTDTHALKDDMGEQLQIVDVMGINVEDDEDEAQLRLVQQTVDNFVRGFTEPGDLDVWESAYGKDLERPEVKSETEHEDWQRKMLAEDEVQPAEDRVQCIVFLISADDENDGAFAAYKSILQWRGQYHSETRLTVHCILAVSKVDQLGSADQQEELRENPKILADGNWLPFNEWKAGVVRTHQLDVTDIFPILDRKSFLRSIKNPMDAKLLAVDNLILRLAARIRKRAAITRKECIDKKGDDRTFKKQKRKRKRKKICDDGKEEESDMDNDALEDNIDALRSIIAELKEEASRTKQNRERQKLLDKAREHREHLSKLMAGQLDLEDLERILGRPQDNDVGGGLRRGGPVHSRVSKQRKSRVPGSTRPPKQEEVLRAVYTAPQQTSHNMQPKLKQPVIFTPQRMGGLPGGPTTTSAGDRYPTSTRHDAPMMTRHDAPTMTSAGYPNLRPTHHDAPTVFGHPPSMPTVSTMPTPAEATSEGMTGGETHRVLDLYIGEQVEAPVPETLKDIYGEWKTATITAIEDKGYYRVLFNDYREKTYSIHHLQMRRGKEVSSRSFLSGAPSSPPSLVRTQTG